MSRELTVNQSFQKLLANLNLTEKQRQRIQTNRYTIDSALSNDNKIHLSTQKQISFLTGSYSRNTIIRPIDDIDLYVRVHYGRHAEGKSPRSILRLMASAIRRLENPNRDQKPKLIRSKVLPGSVKEYDGVINTLLSEGSIDVDESARREYEWIYVLK